MLRGLIFIVFISCLFFETHAQESNEKCVWLKVTLQPQVLDSLTVLPESIRINRPLGLAIHYDFDLGKNEITFQNQLTDSVQADRCRGAGRRRDL